jgi:hypothetical protein
MTAGDRSRIQAGAETPQITDQIRSTMRNGTYIFPVSECANGKDLASHRRPCGDVEARVRTSQPYLMKTPRGGRMMARMMSMMVAVLSDIGGRAPAFSDIVRV